VTDYTSATAKAFRLSADDQQAARLEFDTDRRKNIRNAFLFAVGGWIVLSVVQALLGWIVRGFMGIPWRQDRRPESPTALVETS
jgi:hypothetical protein